jgi:hypothetical protein
VVAGTSTQLARPRRTSALTVLVQAAGTLSLGIQSLYAVGASLFVAGRWMSEGGPVYLPGLFIGGPIAVCFAVAFFTLANALRRGVGREEPTSGALFVLLMTGLTELVVLLFVLLTFRNDAGIEQHAYVRELLIGRIPPVAGFVGAAWTLVVEARRYLAWPAK